MSASFCLEILIYKFSISTILLSNRFKSESVKLFKWHTCFTVDVEEIRMRELEIKRSDLKV